jgi:hypothetical protein
MSQEQLSPPPRPRDGPATTFEADPKVNDIFTGKDGDYFGLVLVAGWPVDLPHSIQEPYQAWLEQLQGCFDQQDLMTTTNQTLPPPVYLYPSMHLHVTIATFAPSEKKRGEHDNIPNFDYDHFQNKYRTLVQEASKLPDWPQQNIQLQFQSAQLGSKAGILLWDDPSGTIQTMRDCLKQAAAKRGMEISGIPSIIHSTFLRFSQVPQTPGEVVQERFQSQVIPNAKEMFDKPINITTAKLVCESTPYMHIPDDDQHTFLTLQLGKDEL